MALTIAAATYEGTGPTQSTQTIIDGPGGVGLTSYPGLCVITLDGATTSGTINFIDGTKTLPFTPSAVQATIGNQSAGPDTINIVVGTVTNTGFPFTLSGAGTGTNKITVCFRVFK